MFYLPYSSLEQDWYGAFSFSCSFVYSRRWRVVNVLKIGFYQPLHLAIRKTIKNSYRKRNSLVSCPGQEKQTLTWGFGTYKWLVGLLFNKSWWFCLISAMMSWLKSWLMPLSHLRNDPGLCLSPWRCQQTRRGNFILPCSYPIGIFFHHILYLLWIGFTGLCLSSPFLQVEFSLIPCFLCTSLLSPHPKLSHFLIRCDCFRIFLVLIIFLSFSEWEEVPFAETGVFLKEFPMAVSERCDRDFQCDLLRKSASQNQPMSKARF